MTQIEFGGQVAIVTGAGRGLGRSHAELLASRGAKVVVNDLAGAQEAVAAIRDAGGEAVASSADISTPAGASELVSAAVESFGTLDILVNNAGVGRFTTMDEATAEEYELVRRAGLDGTFYVTREAWPIFAAKGYGRIVVTTSGNGVLGNPASVTYAIAKAGVFGMMRATALDGESLGIKVNAIGPQASTPMAEAFVSAEMAARMRVEYPTSLVSPIVAVLASSACPVTGQHFDVGGGRVGMTFLATTPGYYDRAMTPESVLDAWDVVTDAGQYKVYTSGYESLEMVEVAKRNAAARETSPA
jgi:NAD(P)-dependent dehydrogenase (short-subunit alcohol dehydrogenase family)